MIDLILISRNSWVQVNFIRSNINLINKFKGLTSSVKLMASLKITSTFPIVFLMLDWTNFAVNVLNQGIAVNGLV